MPKRIAHENPSFPLRGCQCPLHGAAFPSFCAPLSIHVKDLTLMFVHGVNIEEATSQMMLLAQ